MNVTTTPNDSETIPGIKTATIISKFPKTLTRGTVASKLFERNIQILEEFAPSKIRNSTKFRSDLVFLMHEMVSHSDYYRIRTLADKQGKRLILLSRKASTWDKELDMAAPKAVSDKNVPELVNKYIALKNQGKSNEEIVEKLCHFWSGGTISINGFSLYMRSLIIRNRVPGELKEKLIDALKRTGNNRVEVDPKAFLQPNGSVLNQTAKPSQHINGAAQVRAVSKNETAVLTNGGFPKVTIPPAITSGHSNESEVQELAQLYAEENTKLKTEITSLKEKVSVLEKQLAEKKTEKTPALQILRLRAAVKALELHFGNAATTLLEIEKDL